MEIKQKEFNQPEFFPQGTLVEIVVSNGLHTEDAKPILFVVDKVNTTFDPSNIVLSGLVINPTERQIETGLACTGKLYRDVFYDYACRSSHGLSEDDVLTELTPLSKMSKSMRRKFNVALANQRGSHEIDWLSIPPGKIIKNVITDGYSSGWVTRIIARGTGEVIKSGFNTGDKGQSLFGCNFKKRRTSYNDYNGLRSRFSIRCYIFNEFLKDMHYSKGKRDGFMSSFLKMPTTRNPRRYRGIKPYTKPYIDYNVRGDFVERWFKANRNRLLYTKRQKEIDQSISELGDKLSFMRSESDCREDRDLEHLFYAMEKLYDRANINNKWFVVDVAKIGTYVRYGCKGTYVFSIETDLPDAAPVYFLSQAPEEIEKVVETCRLSNVKLVNHGELNDLAKNGDVSKYDFVGFYRVISNINYLENYRSKTEVDNDHGDMDDAWQGDYYYGI